MKTNVLALRHRGNLNASTLTHSLQDNSKSLTISPVHQLGNKLRDVDRNLTGARPPLTLSNRLSPRSNINDKYCVSCVAGNPVYLHVTGKGTCSAKCVTGNRNCGYLSTKKDNLATELEQKGLFCDQQEADCKNFNCKFKSCCKSCSFCKWVSAKEKCKSLLLLSDSRNKECKQCFLL